MPSVKSPLRCDVTRNFSLSCFFRIVSNFFSSSIRFSRTNLLSRILSNVSATMSLHSLSSGVIAMLLLLERAVDALLVEQD